MKRYFFRTLLLSWLILLGGVTVHAQAADILGAVRTAIRNGSSRELSQYLAPVVEVGFDGDKQSYNAPQAEIVIKDFFAKNAATNFDYIHQGASRGHMQYSVGVYTGRNGTYKVFVKFTPPSRGVPLIDSIDFTKE